MAAIQRRGNSFRIKVSCGYDTHGKQVVQSMTWKPDEGMTEKQIEKEVQRQAVLFEEACLKGNIVSVVKFEEFSRQWFSEYAEKRLKAQTIRGYHYLEPRIYKAIGHLRIDKMTPRHVQKFINELSEEERKDALGAKGQKLSAKTVKLHLSLISTVFDYAIKMQMIQTNPCKSVTLPSPDKKERNIYTLEEAQHILELFETEDENNFKYVVFFTMALYTGFRRGELLGLEWSDFGWDNNIVTISRTSNWTKEKGVYTDTPKTASSMRSLKIPNELATLIKRYKLWQDNYKASIGNKWIESNRLFTQWDGKPMDPSAPYYYFQAFCKRNNLRFCNIHSFRHLNAALLITSGVDVKTVQTCLGHSEAGTTMSIYLHTFQAAQARAMDAVAEAIRLKPEETA